MANQMENYQKKTVPLLATLPVFILGAVLLDGVWRIVAVVALLLLVVALSATVGAQVKKQRDARSIT